MTSQHVHAQYVVWRRLICTFSPPMLEICLSLIDVWSRVFACTVSNVVYTICIFLFFTQSPQKPMITTSLKLGEGGEGGIESVFALDKWCYPLKTSPSLIVYSVANYRPYPSHFWANVTLNPIVTIENATPFQSIQTWKCNPIRWQIPNSLLLGSKRHSKYTEDNNKYLWAI